jgi:ribonuclease HI
VLHYKTYIHDNCEDSINAEAQDTPDIKIFTEGSGYDGKVGASAVLYRKGEHNEHSSLTLHLGKLTEHTTYEAEVAGAILATWLLCSIPGHAHLSVIIYTDNQALIRSLPKCTSGPGHYLTNTLRTAINTSSKSLQINWISGHSKVQGNERADELAKLAAQGQSSPATDLPPLLRHRLPLSAAAEKQAYAAEINTMWNEQWQSSPRRMRMEQIDKAFPFKKFRKIQNDLTRAQSSLLLQIRSGHIPLNAHLYRLKCVDTDICQACTTRRGTSPAKETITHFLFDCPAYQYECHDLDRLLGRHNRDLEHIMSNKKNIQAPLKFIG